MKKALAYFLPPEEDIRNEKERQTDEDQKDVDEEVEAAVTAVEKAVGRDRGDLRDALTSLASLLHDHAFLSDLLDLNRALEVLGQP